MNTHFSSIVVPVDGSKGSQNAASFAAKLAETAKTPVVLIHVFSINEKPIGVDDTFGLGLVTISYEHQEDIDQIKEERSKKAFARIYETLGGKPSNFEEKTLIGDPAEEILLYLEENPDSMVIMGRRGLSKIRSLLLGSVSEKIMRYFPGAITVVP
ncbi:universal stress protein [Candidatus Nitrosacidococcus tergens]|uniref:UspA domain protein n=1 Tax=Candidatus Nitrosacidococcus tergens TaxID=553981 RepID=A0A7G1Q8Y1_9GAMM|nr:universal stress protein [Candidatus Nitrosacidococcus tergens]CAB1275575.1 UspA domain protein [Candidatus Nitrosacidococcus tergens]